MLPLSVVQKLVERRDVLYVLDNQDLLNLLAFQPTLLNMIAEFPTDELLAFLATREGIFDSIPPSTEPFLSKLLVSEKFLRKLGPDLLVKLMRRSSIKKLLTKFAVITVLQVYPSIVKLVSAGEMFEFAKFLKDPWFRSRVPCFAISLMSKDPAVFLSLPVDTLESVITSRRFLSCIPARNLEKLMGMRLGLSRLSVNAMLKSARQLPTEKYSMGLLINFLKEQVW